MTIVLAEEHKADMSFDYKNCEGYMPTTHHHGLCAEGGVFDPGCYTCPVNTFFGLWELAKGVVCKE